MAFMQSWIQKLWRISDTNGAQRVLAIVSFTESIFFPIPPDVMLMPMCLGNRAKAFRYALTCLVFSLLGGVVGYFVGYYFMELIGQPIVRFYGFEEQVHQISLWYDKYNAWAVAVAGLTPIPYKVCTLTAGMFHIDFAVFVIASTLARGFRFFCVAGLLYLFGEKVRYFIERRFNLVVTALMVMVVLGFVAVKFIK
ncbi:DedA family protein [Oceanidesulfovibrio indonesiensis]|uniref:DedA family protein n=1 Tax=Oceanidesulfovibrio indonesiensis TaxID=54767 RepID=A0A7M3MBX9_9BACT|nr:YqaA family protein [Oceanidesulfovibrio indonesiensis]TVM15822.1 DedA family protein [Oceanidesulfovibrio indonesiensis]